VAGTEEGDVSTDPFGVDRATRQVTATREPPGRASRWDGDRADRVRPDPCTSVLVVDDVWLFREGVADLLRRQDWTADVRTASSAEAALRSTDAWTPDVVLMSVSARREPDALTTLRAVAAARRVVALVAESDDETVVACAEAGATGLLTRRSTLEDLELTVAGVVRGETRCSPDVAGVLLRQVGRLAADRTGPGDPASLTPREHDVLRLIERGMTNRQIALRLGIEVHTVKNHVHNILEKLQVRSRGEAAARSRASRRPGRGSEGYPTPDPPPRTRKG
jgi:DNA-binding NarL/FixJ family response regulator